MILPFRVMPDARDACPGVGDVVYREVPFQMFREQEQCPVDIYVRIKEEYRLFAAQGAAFTADHYRLFGKQGVRLFILAGDLTKADEYVDQQLGEVLRNSGVSLAAKAELVYTASMQSVRDVFETTNMKTIGELEKLSKNVVRLILGDPKVMDELIAISSHDHYTYKHSVKVGIFGTALCINLYGDRLGEEKLSELSTAFFLHDIGMAKVPLRILDKHEPLTLSEWDILKKHPLWGHDKLLRAKYLNDEAAAVVLYHHERCDRLGYPFKKGGDEIPIHAKICAIADTFESLTSARPFRQAKTPFEALRIMQTEMAREFDADLFRAFIMLLGPDHR